MSSNSSITSTKCKVAGCRFKDSHVTAGHICGTCKQFGHGQCECHNETAKRNLTKYLNDCLPGHSHCTRPKCAHKSLHKTSAHMCGVCGGFHSGYNCPNSPEYEQRRNSELLLASYTNSQTMCTVKCPTCRQSSTFDIEKSKLFGIDTNCIICCSNKVDIRIPCGHSFCSVCVQTMNTHTNNDSTNSDYRVFGPNCSYDELDRYFRSKFPGIDGKVYHSVYAGMGCCWLIRRDKVGEMVEVWFSHSDDHYSPDLLTATNNFFSGYNQI